MAPMPNPPRRVPLLVGLVLTGALAAQGVKPGEGDAKNTLVRQTLTGMFASNFTFKTTLEVDSQFARAMAGRVAARVTRTQGVWSEGRLHATVADGVEAVTAGRRTIVRKKGGAWVRRHDKLADGESMPFVFDPDAFFPVLVDADLEVLRAEVGTLDDRPIEIVTMHAACDAAGELIWAGVVPEGDDTSGMVMFRMGGGGAAPKDDVELDLAFFIDPATKRLLRVRLACYRKPAMGGFVVALGGGAGGDEEEEEAEPDDGKPHPLRFKDGLPIRSKRKSENWTKVHYDVTFAEHGTAAATPLDERARHLLGLER